MTRERPGRALIVIRRPEALIVCFAPSVDPAALEEEAARHRVPGIEISVDARARKVRISITSARLIARAEEVARTLGGSAPVVELP